MICTFWHKKTSQITLGGFVACLGASLEEFIGDVRAILQYNSQKNMLHTFVGLHLI
jgi:hypothetical protein